MKKLLCLLVITVCASNSFAYYQAQEGRWLSRDPIGEQGGVNIYSFVGNLCMNRIDYLGQNAWPSFAGNFMSPSDVQFQMAQQLAPPAPATLSAPGPGDQINPFGCRGRTGTANYTTWFSQRFPNTTNGSKKEMELRISKKACSKMKDKPTSLPDLTGPIDDIDIKSDMVRFGDRSQNWWETHVQIGSFEIKAENVRLNWVDDCCFSYTATMFVQEHTGADAPWAPDGQCDGEDILWFTSMFWSRDVRMAEWSISGEKCCD